MTAAPSRTIPPASTGRPCRPGPARGPCTNGAGARAAANEDTGSRSSTTATAPGWSSWPASAGGPREVPLMGWHNPPLTWDQLERTLSGNPSPKRPPHPGTPTGSRAGESPAEARPRPSRSGQRRRCPMPSCTRTRPTRSSTGRPPRRPARSGRTSRPERARPHRPRRVLRCRPLRRAGGAHGAAPADRLRRRTLPRPPLRSAGAADPPGTHLLVLARGLEGYHRLSGAITAAQLRGGEKGRPVYDLDELAATADGHWTILTGCRKGRSGRGWRPETPLRRCVTSSTSSGATTSPSSSSTTAIRWTPGATTPSPSSPVGCGCPSWRPTTCTTPDRTKPLSPKRWPRSARSGAWTSSTAGCRPTGVRICAAGRR